MAEAPRWSAPVYNLGLLFKYQGRWAESFELNRQATELAPGDQASWWNLGIAATAIGNWSEARRAWLACGMNPPAGDGPPDFGWGMIPVRLDPAASGEVVWARRFDPARAQILSVPLPTARFHWKDLVLTDGAQEGERVVGKRTYPVFNVLDTLEASHYRTFVIELASVTQDVVAALENCAAECGGAAEDWGTTTRILCRACSVGTVHEHADGEHAPAHPHCGLAARDRDHAEGIVSAWLSQNPRADLITWYEAPSTV
ncbi:MAG TPA: hypothetical protein VFW89_06530 [Gemmatimonadaceae bacterium]|nr:hypothetical protein [Gemmatimonadaceae bacterium]